MAVVGAAAEAGGDGEAAAVWREAVEVAAETAEVADVTGPATCCVSLPHV